MAKGVNVEARRINNSPDNPATPPTTAPDSSSSSLLKKEDLINKTPFDFL